MYWALFHWNSSVYENFLKPLYIDMYFIKILKLPEFTIYGYAILLIIKVLVNMGNGIQCSVTFKKYIWNLTDPMSQAVKNQ